MSLAEALRRDLERSLNLLREQYEVAEPLEAECLVFTGAGDSYAAALLAQALSERAVALDPMDAAYGVGPRLARRCVLVAVSVGGRTRVVVEAARRFRGRGGRVVAVTGDPSSPLATASDSVVTLLHSGLAAGVGAGRQLLVVAAIAALLGVPMDYAEPATGCPGRVYGYVYSGCCETLPTALFAALKAFEVYGLPAHWWSVEQLVHAPIYGLPEKVMVFEPLEPLERVREVEEALEEAGVEVYRVPASGSSRLANALASHVWLLRCLAESADLPDEPRYRSHPSLERLTRLIYE